MSAKGLEPLTNGLKGHCSTIELRAQIASGILSRPCRSVNLSEGEENLDLERVDVFLEGCYTLRRQGAGIIGCFPAGVVQLVERLLAKEKVVGSSPIARSVYRQHKSFSGDVAKWEGKGLQNPHHGFKSRRRLLFIE